MDYSRLLVVDFETGPIAPRPKFPPEPVGYAWGGPGLQSEYVAWGHPTGNNCAKGDAREKLRRRWEDPSTLLLMHNAPFDVAVAVEKLGLTMPEWHRIHDTQTLLFLCEPHCKRLGLKPASEEFLGMPPEEKDEVYEWLWDHRVELDLKGRNGGKNVSRKKMGAWISLAPGELVGRYAIGDIDRTLGLFRFLYPRVKREGMLEAYDRERRLMPVLMENERQGLPVDTELLGEDLPVYEEALEHVEDQMRRYLGASGLNFDNDRDVASVFQEVGVIHEDAWVTTRSGNQLSVSKDNLTPDCFVDPLFASAFGYRNRLVTCLKMFMQPWMEQARETGSIYTQWNQVRGSRGGTRTGRPSMTKPNLLNVSKSFEGRNDGYVHPEELQLPELPLVRKYLLPDPDGLWLHRDFDGQELRIFGHFESGDLTAAYREAPTLDPHGWVKDEIARMIGRELDRTSVKIMNFQSLYGGGVTAISKALRISHAEAKQFKHFHETALPGRKLLSEEILKLVRQGEPIRTWGGRLYYPEEPSYSKKHKRFMTWEYKLINYLIQGSAADVTKEAINRWYYGGGPSNGSRFLVTVYDEINISSPSDRWVESMMFLRECMEGIEGLDVPMRSTGKVGERWGALQKCD